MRVLADFTRRAGVVASRLPWVPSTAAGVERRMLDRVGGEVARATTVVRFAPGRRFPEHVHGGGEEFLVLEGVFTDASGDYGAGAYVRNPIGSRHAPWTDGGCTLLVKLRQMHDASEPQVTVRSGDAGAAWRDAGDGARRLDLFSSARTGERVRMDRLEPGATLDGALADGGEELYVVAGGFTDADGAAHEASTWLRYPPGDAGASARRTAGGAGCTLWIKTGHLAPETLAACAAVE